MLPPVLHRLCDPALNCDPTLDPAACAALIGPALFVRWCDVMCESAILGFDKCYCPYRNCSALIVNECGERAWKSKCPDCKRLFCFECKRAWHAGFGCDETGEAMDRNDVAFGRLVEQKMWRRCPRCRHFIELLEGCEIVKCRCQVQVYRHRCRCMRPSTLHVCSSLGIALLFACLMIALSLWALKIIYPELDLRSLLFSS